MLADFERQYVALYRKQQRQQWENYFAKGENDLSTIDNDIFNLVDSHSGQINGTDPKSSIARLIVDRERVDRDPRISSLRNRLDEPRNYVPDPPGNTAEQKRLYRRELSRRMEPDVLALMKNRN